MTPNTHECLSLVPSLPPSQVQRQGDNQKEGKKRPIFENTGIIQVYISLRYGGKRNVHHRNGHWFQGAVRATLAAFLRLYVIGKTIKINIYEYAFWGISNIRINF
jgi:hypothetical protein